MYIGTKKVSPVILSEGIIPSGTLAITENGLKDISKYQYANVNVPIPDGYILPSGEFSITANGTYNIKDYSTVNVNVPIPDGYLKPSGNKAITTTDSVNVARYSTAKISSDTLIPSNIKKDVNVLGITGTYEPAPEYAYFDTVVRNSTSGATLLCSELGLTLDIYGRNTDVNWTSITIEGTGSDSYISITGSSSSGAGYEIDLFVNAYRYSNTANRSSTTVNSNFKSNFINRAFVLGGTEAIGSGSTTYSIIGAATSSPDKLCGTGVMDSTIGMHFGSFGYTYYTTLKAKGVLSDSNITAWKLKIAIEK